MSSRYQRQMGRRSAPSSSSGLRTTSDDTSDALARAERARRLREQRIANLRRDDKALDSKFGYEEFDYKHVQELKSQLQKRERREMLKRQVGNGFTGWRESNGSCYWRWLGCGDYKVCAGFISYSR